MKRYREEKEVEMESQKQHQQKQEQQRQRVQEHARKKSDHRALMYKRILWIGGLKTNSHSPLTKHVLSSGTSTWLDGRHTVLTWLFSETGLSSLISVISLFNFGLPYSGWTMILAAFRTCSVPSGKYRCQSPNRNLYRSRVLLLEIQWAAVTTHWGWINEPPQKNLRSSSPRYTPTCQGHAPWGAVSPFTIRPSGTTLSPHVPGRITEVHSE